MQGQKERNMVGWKEVLCINTSESCCVSFPLSLWSLVVWTKWCVKAWRIHPLSFITFRGFRPHLDNSCMYVRINRCATRSSSSIMQTLKVRFYCLAFWWLFNYHLPICCSRLTHSIFLKNSALLLLSSDFIPVQRIDRLPSWAVSVRQSIHVCLRLHD